MDDNCADLVYALDMFHMVGDPDSFLKELCRIAKAGGDLFIDNGHQSREVAKEKIIASGAFEIAGETPKYMKCKPVK